MSPSRYYPPNVLPENGQKPPDWVIVPNSSEDVLCNEMIDLYWVGIEREVLLLVRTMRAWQKFPGVQIESEHLGAERLLGFQTFVGRAVGWAKRDRERDIIRETIQQMEGNARELSVEQMRAQMLLQGAGFLDIDKIIEYRPPMEDFRLWATPRAPQLTLANYDPVSHIPEFRPLTCSECSSVIRGTQFRCLDNHCSSPEGPQIFCETCKRSGKHHFINRNHLRKYEKHCILRETVTPERSRQICTCRRGETEQVELEGADTLFAVVGKGPHRVGCPLWQLKQRHEQAKKNELSRHNRNAEEANSRESRRAWLSLMSFLRPKNVAERQDRAQQGESTGISGKLVGRAVAAHPPTVWYGNIHMALMVGPIIIENGVPGSKKGARITIRGSPQLAMTPGKVLREGPEMCVGSSPRQVYRRYGPCRARRIKACMKQVVCGAFTGFFNDALENEIVDALVSESRKCGDFDSMRAQQYDEDRMKAAARRICEQLQTLLASRVVRYFRAIAAKLFEVDLRYNTLTNHCQSFCANILNYRTFGSFLATSPTCRLHVPRHPLYLVSFICPPGSYDAPRRVRPQSKRDAPNGLTEEYLLRFRKYGHHDESDIADTLLEYWYDWGAFGSPLYEYQDLFPWDCTEAFRMGEGDGSKKCNNCNIAMHVWSFPFDSWSLVQHHVLKEKTLYSPPHTSAYKTLTDEEWMRNRLTILSALKALNTVAAAMARTPSFRETCRWNCERNRLNPDAVSRRDRIKLSGIHRAQPYSHDFEKSKDHDCTLAEWVLLSRSDQIREYERLRDYRAEEMADVTPPPAPSVRSPDLPPRTRNEEQTSQSSSVNFGLGAGPGAGGNDEQHNFSEHHPDPEAADGEYGEADPGYEAGGGLLPDSFGPDPPDELGAEMTAAPVCQCDENDDPGWVDDEYDYFDNCDEHIVTQQHQQEQELNNRSTSEEIGRERNPERQHDGDDHHDPIPAYDDPTVVEGAMEMDNNPIDDELADRIDEIIGVGGDVEEARARFQEAYADINEDELGDNGLNYGEEGNGNIWEADHVDDLDRGNSVDDTIANPQDIEDDFGDRREEIFGVDNNNDGGDPMSALGNNTPVGYNDGIDGIGPLNYAEDADAIGFDDGPGDGGYYDDDGYGYGGYDNDYFDDYCDDYYDDYGDYGYDDSYDNADY